MLHKINLPGCHPALTWIVQLQTDLLTALCAHGISARDVTAEWVASHRPGIDDKWVKRFCSWTREGTSILARMQDIAALPPNTKDQILRHFNKNLQYADAFDTTKSPPPTTPLPNGLEQEAATKYRAFLEVFYDPAFYKQKGFPVHADGSRGGCFHKDIFIKRSHTDNDDLGVCPLCDGELDDSEVDHWLAKKHFPELACHPYNLVEICGACNGRSNKGEKLTLSPQNVKAFDDWFHPYLRPASGTFTIQIEEKGVVTLKAKDIGDEARIANLDRLVNLYNRWKVEYRTQFKRVLKKIYGRKCRGQIFTEQSLKGLVDEWLGDVQSEIGLKPHAMLEESLLRFASDVRSNVFEEFLKYANS